MSQSLWQWWQSRLDRPKLGEAGESRWIQPTSQRAKRVESERQENASHLASSATPLLRTTQMPRSWTTERRKSPRHVGLYAGCRGLARLAMLLFSGWFTANWLTRPHDRCGACGDWGSRWGRSAGTRSGVGPEQTVTREAVHWIIWRAFPVQARPMRPMPGDRW